MAWPQTTEYMQPCALLGEEIYPIQAAGPMAEPVARNKVSLFLEENGSFCSNSFLQCLTLASLGSFLARFLRAKMASTWTLRGRDVAAVFSPGRSFMMGLRLAG